jgi:hypothetical protein
LNQEKGAGKMKSFCCFVAIAVCLGISGIARADSIDFSMNILDPPPGGTFLYSDTFSAPFSACSAFSSPSAPAPVLSDYCFEGINATGVLPNTTAQIWTSLAITIDDPSDLLGLNNATCGALDSPDSIFTSNSCTETSGVYTLDFSGGSIGSGQSFFIAIAVPQTVTLADLNSLPTTAVANGVPEPNSALLLVTGTAMFGLLLYAERRRVARQSSSS